MAVNDTISWPTVALPFGSTIESYFKPKSDAEVLKSSLICLVLTSKGERLMEPEIGTGVPKLPFEPLDEVESSGTIEEEIRTIVARLDDRLDNISVKTKVNNDANSIEISVNATYKQDPDKSLSFNFEIGTGV